MKLLQIPSLCFRFPVPEFLGARLIYASHTSCLDHAA